MSSYVGGSAPAMVRQIRDGYTLVNVVMLKRFSVAELDTLKLELEKKLRELRGEQVDVTDTPAIQLKNRRLSRLEGALRVIRTSRNNKVRGRA
ncbi:MAG TPA: hypothetical protein ENK19_03175 [Acidobacteria bacterium]|nr:hypothetical protein [Acidobacteriota bacterium]